MAQDLINEAGVYPVNSNGEIVLQSGTGNNTVVGYINSSQVPTDVSTNKMVVKMPSDVPSLNVDSLGNTTGVIGTNQGIVASRPTLIAGDFGASFNELNDLFGLNFSTPINITGITVAKGSLKTSTGSATLKFRASDKSMCVALPGEAEGAYVPVGDGIFFLPSGNNTLRVNILNRLLPTQDAQDVLTSGTRYWSRPNGSWKYQLSFISQEQMRWLATQGIGGSQSGDITGHMNQIKNQGAQIQFMCASGNDSVTGNVSVADSISQTLANADVILKTGVPVVLQLLPPRYGKSAAGAALSFSGEYTAQRQGNLVSCNRGYTQGAYKRNGLYIADFSSAVNPLDSQGAVWNGWTADGKHPAGGLAHCIADSNWKAISWMFSGYKYSHNVGLGDYYNASTNPGGNLLQPGRGSFAGNTGTKNGAIINTPTWATATSYAAKAYAITYPASTVTISIASPGVVTLTAHGLTVNTPIIFTTTGALPTGITAGTVYYVAPSPSANTFSVSSTLNGTAINTTGTQSGVHTLTVQLGNLYYTDLGGTSGITAPTHTGGTASDGTVNWTYIYSGVTGGLADGWTATLEGTCNVSCHTLTSKDGTREQEFIVSGATVDGGAFRASPGTPTVSNFATDDVIAWEYDVSITNPSDCYGLFSDTILTGGNSVIWDNQSMSSVQQGLSWTQGKLALEPMPFPAGVTNVQPRTHAQSKMNGNFRIRYKNATMYKVGV